MLFILFVVLVAGVRGGRLTLRVDHVPAYPYLNITIQNRESLILDETDVHSVLFDPTAEQMVLPLPVARYGNEEIWYIDYHSQLMFLPEDYTVVKSAAIPMIPLSMQPYWRRRLVFCGPYHELLLDENGRHCLSDPLNDWPSTRFPCPDPFHCIIPMLGGPLILYGRQVEAPATIGCHDIKEDDVFDGPFSRQYPRVIHGLGGYGTDALQVIWRWEDGLMTIACGHDHDQHYRLIWLLQLAVVGLISLAWYGIPHHMLAEGKLHLVGEIGCAVALGLLGLVDHRTIANQIAHLNPTLADYPWILWTMTAAFVLMHLLSTITLLVYRKDIEIRIQCMEPVLFVNLSYILMQTNHTGAFTFLSFMISSLGIVLFSYRFYHMPKIPHAITPILILYSSLYIVMSVMPMMERVAILRFLSAPLAFNITIILMQMGRVTDNEFLHNLGMK